MNIIKKRLIKAKYIGKAECIEYITYPFFGPEDEQHAFFNKLKEIENNAVDSKHEYAGNFYSEFTYILPNKEKWIYTEDDDKGVAYSLKRVE